MFVACLPLLVAMLVGLPSTVTAKTRNRQQLDTSGVFGGKHLSKHQTHFVGDTPKLNESRIPKFNHPEYFLSLNTGSFEKYELETQIDSGRQLTERDNSSFNSPKILEKANNDSFPCPEPTDIAPCICYITGNSELVLDCSFVESEAELAGIFVKEFPVKQFNEFRIVHNDNIQHLVDIFNGISFAYIYLHSLTKLSEITKYAFFDSRDYLETIDIFSSALDENTFPFSTLNEFPKLTSLIISFSNIKFWPTFDSSSITKIDFHGDHVSVLPAGKQYGRPL